MNFILKKIAGEGCDYNDVKARNKIGNLSGAVGIALNLLLCIIKIAAGVFSGAISLIADGLNNLSDMGSSVVTIIGFKLSAKPADADHPYGHGRMEYMSALLVAALIITVGVEMLKSSVGTLISGESAPSITMLANISLVISIAVKLGLFILNRYLSRLINSEVLAATAKDSLNDCVASGAILLSLIITSFVELPFNLDAVMALGVSLFILWAGFCAARDTVDELLGKPADKATVEEIKNIVLSFDTFYGIHDLIVHSYGPGRQFASVHVEVPLDSDIAACHEQADICERLVRERLGIELVIHTDPIDVNNETVTSARKAMAEAIKGIDERLTLHDFRMTAAGKTYTNLIFDVVVPAGMMPAGDALRREIAEKAKQINENYLCVITLDNDYTAK